MAISVDNVLALRQSILQRNNALKDVSNGAAGGIGGGVSGAPDQAGKADFTQALKSAINGVNDLQTQAGDAAAAYERGDTTDIAGVMLAKQQASIGFETTLQVRNKLLSAYKDIMSMPV
ncbi:flagellar hook-basal body complex protein FliE [Sphingobium nicotianae]|uniref:Flagellar hook-basal body complex protein FliE n=1 Tax=Sphingobium nicotianae TaxID=2782607 RepID=A0A9X1DAK0_9SPHN|nr:flagellar hook-basal body complex protein FliE [Sphingobium nicotianae]MBT2186490.1 flagellar hook-basal body complex protein FliE [Sphingobium nicotianae]